MMKIKGCSRFIIGLTVIFYLFALAAASLISRNRATNCTIQNATLDELQTLANGVAVYILENGIESIERDFVSHGNIRLSFLSNTIPSRYIETSKRFNTNTWEYHDKWGTPFKLVIREIQPTLRLPSKIPVDAAIIASSCGPNKIDDNYMDDDIFCIIPQRLIKACIEQHSSCE